MQSPKLEIDGDKDIFNIGPLDLSTPSPQWASFSSSQAKNGQ
jgi:hypothetical protein